MFRIRSIISTGRASGVLTRIPTPMHGQRHGSHDDGPPQPFDNMPFKIRNRFLTTVIFAVLFGTGLWAPFAIVWYQMAKRTM